MADAREKHVWDIYAGQQKESGKSGFEYNFSNLVREKIKARAGNSKPKLLDFGCGTGIWYNVFKDISDYYGADQNETMISFAKERHPNISDKFLINDWKSLPLETNSFDIIFSSAVLQHNKHEDKKPVLSDIHRVLRPGGYYIALEVTLKPEDVNNGYSFDPAGWEEFISGFGFKLDCYIDPCVYFFVKE